MKENRIEQQELYLRSTDRLPFRDIGQNAVVRNAVRAINGCLSAGKGQDEVFYPELLTERQQERIRRFLPGSLKKRVVFITGVHAQDGDIGTMIEITKKRG